MFTNCLQTAKEYTAAAPVREKEQEQEQKSKTAISDISVTPVEETTEKDAAAPVAESMDAPPASISTDDTPSSPPGTETSEAKKEGSSSGDKRSITDELSTDEETFAVNVEPEAKKAKTPSPPSKDKKEEVYIECAAEKKEGEEMHESEDDKVSPVSSSKEEPDAEEEGVSADTKKENE